MARKAYFFIETAIGKSRDVSLALRQCEWVEFIERVTGPYDVVGIARGQESCEVDDLINDGIRPIDGIIRVVVCPISTALESGVPRVTVAVP